MSSVRQVIMEAVMKVVLGLLFAFFFINAYAKTTLLATVTYDDTFISAYKEVEPDSKEKECFILLGNKQFRLLVYPENIRGEDTPLYVIYLDNMTVDIAYLQVDNNKIIRIDGLIFTEKRKYTLHHQLMAGNMLSMRTYDVDSSSIDMTIPLKGYTRLTRKIEAACK